MRFIIRMASVLAQLDANANKADEMISMLKIQLASLKEDAVAQACRREKLQLQAENEKLKAEIASSKSRLMKAEIKIGVPQIPWPNSSGASFPRANPAASMFSTVSNEFPKTYTVPTNAANKQRNLKKGKKEKVQTLNELSAQSDSKKGKTTLEERPIDVSRLNMKVGKIVSVKKHPEADTLYVEEVDVGEAVNRMVVSGLVNHVLIEEMQGKIAVFMCNLKPAKMRGIVSQGMIMCASTPDKVEVLVPPSGSQPGDRVKVNGYDGDPDDQLNPKKKIWEQVAPDLRVNGERFATFKGVPMEVEDKGLIKAPSLANVQIK